MIKKLGWLAFLFLYAITLFGYIEVNAEESADYLSYSEIMLSSGKLIKDFTIEEREAMYKYTEGRYFIDIVPYFENRSVDGSYISNTLYSIDNTSKTSIEYTLEYTVETNNKVSFQTSDSISSQFGFTKGKIKGDLAAKATVDYTETTTKSIKEKKTMKLEIEPNSRLIVYLTGNISVTNGVFALYFMGGRTFVGCFEFVTLKSQFSKMEKRSIWKR